MDAYTIQFQHSAAVNANLATADSAPAHVHTRAAFAINTAGRKAAVVNGWKQITVETLT